MYEQQQFTPIDCSALVAMLKAGNPVAMQEIYHNKQAIQSTALVLLDLYKQSGAQSIPGWDNVLESLMMLCDIVYNNFDGMDVIDDGIYDSLIIVYRKIFNKPHIGGAPVQVNLTTQLEPDDKIEGYHYPFATIDPAKAGETNTWLFYDNLKVLPPYNPAFYGQVDRSHYTPNRTSHQSVPHKYPKLVGTLEKCKFVLMSEAASYDLLNDPTVKIFERDFLSKHINMGIVNPYNIQLLLELKLDGMSVEADVTNVIQSARSRGDTDTDEAEDLSIVFSGYKFPYCPEMSESFGMKFECIITKANLIRLGQLKGRTYKNARNGVIGLVKSLDAQAFRDLVTLVPLETSLDIDPITEVQFMNQYYTKDVYLPYAVAQGDYNQVLYQVYRFVKEAEAMRDVMPYLYDGVVVHYVDPTIRQRLGRSAAVNNFSIAIKFNPMRKKSIFRGYTYTVGQDGRITPMAHYDPVEFLGGIHTKSSCHSYGRFRELQLCKGDVVELTYVNDVMPYLTKPYAGEYRGEYETAQPPEQFPVLCPFCGSQIVISDGGAGDLAICPNIHCPERQIGKVVNMLDKLSIKGFAEAAVRKLQIHSLPELIAVDPQRACNELGEANGKKLIDAIRQFTTTPMPDYRIVGAIGITGVAAETWKKILSVVHIQTIYQNVRQPINLAEMLQDIKGIGPKTANVIAGELPLYEEDLRFILTLPNLVVSYGAQKRISVRWTGVRDKELENKLNAIGIDANSKAGVTKSTNILVVPYAGFVSDKMKKISTGCLVVPYDDFARDYMQYLAAANTYS